METTRYDELRTLVAANFSETTQRLVDEALAYAACTTWCGSPPAASRAT